MTERRPASPAHLAQAAQLACVLEACAEKPGNVTRRHDFEDAHLEDFLLSASAVGPVFDGAGERPVGETVLAAVRATRARVATNTNLGIVLLLAPLARAAAAGGPLREAVRRVLASLTRADAEAVYEAIRLARPGGLGRVPEQDVRDPPTLDLRAVMGLAAERDTIAREYVTDFAVTFERTVPALRDARDRGLRWTEAATEAYLAVLAEVPDSLIARKGGAHAADRVTREARGVVSAGPPGSAERKAAAARLDAWLRAPGHPLNPGTTADLTAAGLFVMLLDHLARSEDTNA